MILIYYKLRSKAVNISVVSFIVKNIDKDETRCTRREYNTHLGVTSIIKYCISDHLLSFTFEKKSNKNSNF